MDTYREAYKALDAEWRTAIWLRDSARAAQVNAAPHVRHEMRKREVEAVARVVRAEKAIEALSDPSRPLVGSPE